MAQQVLTLGEIAPFQGAILLDPALVEGGGIAYFRFLQRSGTAIDLRLAISATADPQQPGPGFAELVLVGDDALTFHDTGSGSSVVLKGPGNADNVFADRVDPYFWIPDNINAFFAWSLSITGVVTLTIDDGRPRDVLLGAALTGGGVILEGAPSIVGPLSLAAPLTGAGVDLAARLSIRGVVPLAAPLTGAGATLAADLALVGPLPLAAPLTVAGGDLGGNLTVREALTVAAALSGQGADLAGQIDLERRPPVVLAADLRGAGAELASQVRLVGPVPLTAALTTEGAALAAAMTIRGVVPLEAPLRGAATLGGDLDITRRPPVVLAADLSGGGIALTARVRLVGPVPLTGALTDAGATLGARLSIRGVVPLRARLSGNGATLEANLSVAGPLPLAAALSSQGADLMGILDVHTPPQSDLFYAAATGRTPGVATVELLWATVNAATVTISGLGAVPVQGERQIAIVADTTWTIEVRDAVNRVIFTETRSVTVAPPPAPRALVRILGAETQIRPDSLKIQQRVNQRWTADFRLLRSTAELPVQRPPENAPVEIEEAVSGRLLFGGVVYGPDLRHLPGAQLTDITVHAVSYAERLDSRRIEMFYRVPPGRPVILVVRDIMQTWAAGEPITTVGVVHTGLTLGAVFDWITIAEALTALAEMVNGQWNVVPVPGGGDLRFESRGAATLSPIVIHQTGLVRLVDEQIDRQRLTTVQTVIGASPSGGTRTDEFVTDGVTREWPLTYPVDRVTEISLDGVGQDFSGAGAAWRIDTRRSVVIQLSDPIVPAGRELIVLYNWNFPLVITRESAAGIAAWGRIHRLEQNAGLDTIESVESRCETLLARNDHPTTLYDVPLRPFQEGPQSGELAQVWLPALGQRGERWLVDRASIRARGTSLIWRLQIVARDHLSRYETYYTQIRRLVHPTSLMVAPTPQSDPIDPLVLAQEGLRLPAALGGDANTRGQSTDWTPIPGATIVRLNGRSLPTGLVQWYATFQTYEGSSARLRLYDRQARAPRGREFRADSATRELAFVRRITLTAEIRDYELQYRLVAPVTSPVGGIRIMGGTIDLSNQ